MVYLLYPGIKILLKRWYYILLSIFCTFINPGACAINFFMALINYVSPSSGTFVTVSQCLPCLIFQASMRAYPKSYSWYTLMNPGIKILLKQWYYILVSIFCCFINPGACTINFFMAVINNVSPQAGKFVTLSHFLPPLSNVCGKYKSLCLKVFMVYLYVPWD